MLCEAVKQSFRDAARKLTGYNRRTFEAGVVNQFFNGNARISERELGWGRKTIEKGQHELMSGFRCVDNFNARGTNKTERVFPNLEKDLRDIVEPHSQTDPKFQSSLVFTPE